LIRFPRSRVGKSARSGLVVVVLAITFFNIEDIGRQIEKVVMQVEGTTSAYSERVAGGRYIEISPDRVKAARLGLNISDINAVISAAVGGINITETIEGLERYPEKSVTIWKT